MRYFNFIICIGILLVSCNSTEKSEVKNSKFPDLKSFFQLQISMLDSIKPVIHKTMVNNEDPMDVKMDSADWKEELSLFEMLDLRTAANEDKYTESVDSNGNLKIQRFSALDSNREIQSLSITYRNNEIELIEAFLKKRTFVVDRDTRMSYQPGKGYGIQLDENYIWSKPHTKEIFVELEPNGFLKK